MPKKYEEMSKEEVKGFINSKLFQRYLAYRGLTDGLKQLKKDDVMFKQLTKDINEKVTKVRSRETIKQILNAFVDVVEESTALIQEEKGEQNE